MSHSSMHCPTHLPHFSSSLLPAPLPYRPSSLVHLTHVVLAVSSHTRSPSQPIFSLTLPRAPPDLTPPSHIISHHCSTASCHCLLLPWMAQKGVESRRQQAGRTASTEINKEAVAQPLAFLSACPSPAQHRPCPSSSGQHTKHFQ